MESPISIDRLKAMAASPEIQIRALQSLLEVKENVDKEVHMKCVITALSTAYLDADTALKISAVIEQQSSFSAEDKARLQKAVGDQVREVGSAKKGGRKPYQDYTKVENFLTDDIWDGLMSYPYGRSCSLLLEHAWNLGLRSPYFSNGVASWEIALCLSAVQKHTSWTLEKLKDAALTSRWTGPKCSKHCLSSYVKSLFSEKCFTETLYKGQAAQTESLVPLLVYYLVEGCKTVENLQPYLSSFFLI